MKYFILTAASFSVLWLIWELRKLRSLDGRGTVENKLKLKIEAFTGFGKSNVFRIAGRLSKDGGRLSALNAEFDLMGIAGKFRRNLRRFILPEMEEVPLEIRVGGITRETNTSAHGRFTVRFEEDPLLEPGITTYSVRLHESEARYEAPKVVGQLVIVPEGCRLGIISDVDDTIVQSHIRNKFRMLLHTALTNVSDLKPTAGMSALLRELSTGKTRQDFNPVFYVSGSPVNLHDKLQAFLRANRFPVGPIFLTSIGRNPEAGFFSQKIFKTERIRDLFTTFPKMQFVLIGDNGQYDPDIYHQIALDFPGRVALTLIYECVSRLQIKKILPLGQHRFDSALEGGIVLYRKGLITKEGLRTILNELIAAGVLKESFNLDKMLARLERRDKESRKLRLFHSY